jgi:Zn-dependent protease
MLSSSFRLFRVFGIDVGVHVSWLVIFGLVTWSLAMGYFPVALPGIDAAIAWVLGAVAAILLFASVLIHELAHSLVARARGLDARSITLFLFGGVSNLGGEAKRPSTEFLVAVVGPLTSLAIAGVAFVATTLVGSDTGVGVVAGYLAIVNLLLAAFNLLPGFPLDGGRVLRAMIWNATGSLRRGTEIATTVGRLVAYGLVFWGVLRVLDGEVFAGLWIGAIGWFLANAASASLQQVVVDQRLAGLRVRDVVRPDTTAVLPGASVAEVIELVMLPGTRRAVPVVDGRLIGIVTLGDVGKVPPERRDRTWVGEIMGGTHGLVTVTPDDTLVDALQALGKGDYEQVPVVDERGGLIGLLTRADILRVLQLREALDIATEGSSSTT